MPKIEKASWSNSRCKACGEPFQFKDWWYFEEEAPDDEERDEVGAPRVWHLRCGVEQREFLETLLATDSVPDRDLLVVQAAVEKLSHKPVVVDEVISLDAPVGATRVIAEFRSGTKIGRIDGGLTWAKPGQATQTSARQGDVVRVERCPRCGQDTLEARVAENANDTLVFACRSCGHGFSGDA